MTAQTEPMDSSLAVVLQTISQAQAAMAADVTALRTDMTRVVTKLDVADAARSDFETRLRVIEQRPSSVDLEVRVRRLEAWRYALPTATLLGLGSTVAAIVALVHH
jgi:hypothetical protein